MAVSAGVAGVGEAGEAWVAEAALEVVVQEAKGLIPVAGPLGRGENCRSQRRAWRC